MEFKAKSLLKPTFVWQKGDEIVAESDRYKIITKEVSSNEYYAGWFWLKYSDTYSNRLKRYLFQCVFSVGNHRAKERKGRWSIRLHSKE